MASRRSLTVWAVLLFATLAMPAGAAGPRKTARQRDGLPATFTFVGGLHPGQPGQLAISWRGKEATELTIWVDFNCDDHWTDDEIIAKNRRIEPGIEVVGFEVPAGWLRGITPSIRYRTSGEADQEGFGRQREGRMNLAGNGAESSSCQWESGWTVPDLDGTVYALATFDDGSGTALYVGGSFFTAGGVRALNIAKWNGVAWSALGGGLGRETNTNIVCSLEIYDDGSGPALYAGGSFDYSGSTLLRSLGKWNGTQWVPVSGGVYGTVKALRVWNGLLFVGGSLTIAGSVSVNRIASWNGQSWSDVGGGVGSGSSSVVNALETYDDGTGEALYVAGNFGFSTGNQNAIEIARWDGSSWSALGSGMNNSIHALATFDPGSGPLLIAGGYFTTAGGVAANHVAAWDGSNWTPLGSGVDDVVDSLFSTSFSGTPTLFVGGGFSTAGGVPVKNIAAWTGSAWQALGTGCDGGEVLAMGWFDEGAGGRLFVGGSFVYAGGNHAGHIANWDGLQWESYLAGTDGNGFDDQVLALAAWDDGTGMALYAGGKFTVAGATEVAHIARWDGSHWVPLGSGTDGTVYTLALYDDGNGPALYAGGEFAHAGGVSAANIAKWDGSQWSALGNGLNDTVRALAVYDDGSGPALYAGGIFTKSGSWQTVNRIARWKGSGWSAVGGGLDNYVSALIVYDDHVREALFAIGGFTDYIERWDGTAWSVPGGGLDKWGMSLAVFDAGDGARLIVSGSFGNAGGQPAKYAAAWDGSTWKPLGTGPASPGNSLSVFDDGTGPALYAGAGINNISKFDGTTWSSPLPRLDSFVAVMLPMNIDGKVVLFAGGDFRTAGTVSSAHIASWSCTCSANTGLTAGDWQMIGLPCSPTGATMGDIFGDDLAPTDYDSRWVMYEWDRASEQYTKLSLNSTLDQGTGYWIRTLDAGQTIDVDGRPTAMSCSGSRAFSVVGCFSESLTGSPAGRWNMIGHPMAYTVNWADVRFVDDSGNEWTPSQAEAHGVASKNLYTWNGSAYQTWDDVTPGMLGTLGVFEGQWVKAYSTATALRIPAMPASGSLPAPAQPSEEGEWLIRLTATSGKLADPGNVLGRLADSREGLDAHDLPEMAPFNGDYLTIVFPHPQWRTTAWAYTTDFRALEKTGTSDTGARGGPALPQPMGEVWHFEVRSGTARRKVVLHWQGPANILRRSLLVDLASGREIHPRPGSSYAVEMTKTTHSFNWIVMPPNDDGRRR